MSVFSLSCFGRSGRRVNVRGVLGRFNNACYHAEISCVIDGCMTRYYRRYYRGEN